MKPLSLLVVLLFVLVNQVSAKATPRTSGSEFEMVPMKVRHSSNGGVQGTIERKEVGRSFRVKVAGYSGVKSESGAKGPVYIPARKSQSSTTVPEVPKTAPSTTVPAEDRAPAGSTVAKESPAV